MSETPNHPLDSLADSSIPLVTRSLFAPRVILLLAGTVASLVGLADLLVPVQIEAGVGVVVGTAPALLNELRASGGGLLAVGCFILAGAFIAELTSAATLLAAIVYLGFASGRLLSLAVDGLATPPLFFVNAIEIAIGAWSLIVFLRCRKHTGI